LLDITDDYKNDSDSMSDYHEKDAIYFKESNQYYNTVRECYIQKMTKNFHRQIAWYDRRKIVVSPSTYAEMLQKLDVLSLIPKHAIT
jgi:hypothetical protein